LGQPYAAFARTVLMPLALPVSLLLGVLLAGRLLVTTGPWILAIGALGAIVYFGTLWRMPTGRDIRLMLRGDTLSVT